MDQRSWLGLIRLVLILQNQFRDIWQVEFLKDAPVHRGFASCFAIYDETDGWERSSVERRQNLLSQEREVSLVVFILLRLREANVKEFVVEPISIAQHECHDTVDRQQDFSKSFE
jgi:hypothetical protein